MTAECNGTVSGGQNQQRGDINQHGFPCAMHAHLPQVLPGRTQPGKAEKFVKAEGDICPTDLPEPCARTAVGQGPKVVNPKGKKNNDCHHQGKPAEAEHRPSVLEAEPTHCQAGCAQGDHAKQSGCA